MIQIEPYTKEFEEEYLDTVLAHTDTGVREKIMTKYLQCLPGDFSGTEKSFEALILAPFDKLKEAHGYMSRMSWNRIEKKHIIKAYKTVARAKKKGVSMRIRIVRNTGLTVCPYCNRDYINCRSEDTSGAEMDHFYSIAKFPAFALCLYNLVPSCGNCNRIKNAGGGELASPFDRSIDWGRDVVFSYLRKEMDEVEVTIEAHGFMKNNVDKIKIREAYQIHNVEVKELLEKCRAYSDSQREEMREVLKEAKISDEELKQIIFGPKLDNENIRTKSLGKMMSDLHRELGIY